VRYDYFVSPHDSFVGHFWKVTKIDEQAELKSGCLQIIMDLGTVLISQFRDGFNLHNDEFITEKIGLECLLQLML